MGMWFLERRLRIERETRLRINGERPAKIAGTARGKNRRNWEKSLALQLGIWYNK